LNPIPPWLPVAAFLLVLGMLPVVSWSIAQAGGWTALARRYRTAVPWKGFLLPARSGRMKALTAYNHALNLGAGPEGLFLSANPLLRAGHPPLLVPWDGLRAEETAGWFGPWVRLTFPGMPDLYLKLRKRDVLELQKHSGSPEAFRGLESAA
jgi:hypothetical protein